jgi:uncharacterized membrane protein
MNSKNKISNAVALFTTGILAGTFFYVKFNVLPTFWDVPADVHLSFRSALMKHNDIVFQILMVSAIISSIWFTWRIRLLKHVSVFAGFAVILGITTFLISYFGNIPINAQLKIWIQTSPPKNWVIILKTWDFYHTCRTVTAIASFTMILIASFFKQELLKKQSKRFN